MKKFNLKEINKYIQQDRWDTLSKYYKLPVSFIEKYKDKINWDRISIFQKLPEKFIGKYQNKVNWYWISLKQKLSEKFIVNYIDKIVLWNLLYNRRIKFTKDLLKFLLFKANTCYEKKIILRKLKELKNEKV